MRIGVEIDFIVTDSLAALDLYERIFEVERVEVTEMQDYGVSNSMFTDVFGYTWMLHEVHREVSFEERVQLWENRQEAEHE